VKNKVIFLDIDGVLATIRQFAMKPNAKTYLAQYNVYPFDKKCVEIFNEILDETDAEIVLDSDWRLYYSLEELDDIFKINGVNKSPVLITEDLGFLNSNYYAPNLTGEELRAREIKNAIKEHNINKFIAIDDMNMTSAFNELSFGRGRFIHCKDDYQGIKQNGIKEKCIKKLNV
jgi:hypothetical protein